MCGGVVRGALLPEQTSLSVAVKPWEDQRPARSTTASLPDPQTDRNRQTEQTETDRNSQTARQAETARNRERRIQGASRQRSRVAVCSPTL